MKKLYILIFISLFFSLFVKKVLASNGEGIGVGNVQVSAAVGSYDLNIYGYIAPFASISIVYGNNILASTVSNSQGYFSFLNILVPKDYNKICFDAVDFKRLGDSQSCFVIQPVTQDTTIRDLFLPPTIGLYRTSINLGSNAIVFGYSMPNALVNIHLSNGSVYQTTSNNTGYYEIHIYIPKSGTYQFFADATFQNKKSQEPLNKVTILVLGIQEQITHQANKLFQIIPQLFTNWWVILFLLITAIIILLIILWKKLKAQPSGFAEPAPETSNLFDVLFHNKKLHHAWFVGY